MSNFVFIIPEGWTQISQDLIDVIGVIQIDNWVKMADYYSLGQALREAGGPEYISEAVFFNAEVLAVR